MPLPTFSLLVQPNICYPCIGILFNQLPLALSPMGRYHFVHCTDSDGRRPTNAVGRKRLHRHVMLNYLARARTLTEEDSEENEEDLKEALLGQLSYAELLAASNLPAPHEFNATLEDIGLPTLAKIDDFWKWQFLSDFEVNSRTGWVAEARSTWGTTAWDAALADHLIFLTLLQVVLNKVATVTGVNQDLKIHLLASRALPILNERLQEPSMLKGHEAWCVSAFVYLAVRTGDYALAKLHLNGMQLILDIHEADRSSWPYIYWVDIRLAGILRCRPFLRKSFNRSLWPPQASQSLNKVQAAIIERSANTYLRRFGTGLVHFQDMVKACFIQMLSCEMIQKSKAFSVVSQTECLYSLSYDICSLHGMISEQPYDDRIPSTPLVELLAIAIKLCAWSMCKYSVPQSGEVTRALLQRVGELLSMLPTDPKDVMTLLNAYNMDIGHALWILFVAYVEAYQHFPPVQCTLRPLMEAMATRLGHRQPSQLAANMQRMPCIELLYAKRSPFACRQILSNDDSRWRPVEDWSFMRKRSPLAGFITAQQFDIEEGDLE